jgi:LacI family transcriptional regulator
MGLEWSRNDMEGGKRQPPRLSDIASRLGLSKAAISKALRDSPDISPSTRERVKLAAHEMGYLPNFLARSLTTGSKVFGVVIPKVQHTFFAAVLAGINSAVAARDFEMVLGISGEDPVVERRHVETFLSMRAAALLISVTEHTRALDEQLCRSAADNGVPLVFFDRVPTNPGGVKRVVMDDFGGAKAAVAASIDHGYRRVAHLAGSSVTNIGRDRRAGYEAALREAGIAPRGEWIIESRFDEQAGFDGFQKLWAQSERPDALFCASFPVALGAIHALKVHAPEHLSKIVIIFFGLGDIVHLLDIQYICVVQPAVEMGRAAATMAFTALADPLGPTEQILGLEIVCAVKPRTAS